MCGGCGGPRRVINVQKQEVKPIGPTKKRVITKRIPRTTIHNNKVEIKRQYVIPRQTCPKCGYPAMMVNIANRERYQCSNSNCRFIIK